MLEKISQSKWTRPTLGALAVGVPAAALGYFLMKRQKSSKPSEKSLVNQRLDIEASECIDDVDLSSLESFPASDPPSTY